jgi:epoxyqueuosine reductase
MNLKPITTEQLIAKAKELGASTAGIASAQSLQNSPSYQAKPVKMGWPPQFPSLLVLTLAHPQSDPELDWWDVVADNTPGNKQLATMAKTLAKWLDDDFGIASIPLAYQLHNGGVYLKDATALAGLGTIGRHNLLITLEFGTQVRLRALLLELNLEPTGPIDFAPCEDCDAPCMPACPQNAFREGTYNKKYCEAQMALDESKQVNLTEAKYGSVPREVIKYCRVCELSCPVGRI